MRVFYTSLLIISAHLLLAQQPAWHWATNLNVVDCGFDPYPKVVRTTVDRFGNCFVLNACHRKLPGHPTITKFSTAGKLLWSHTADVYANDITVDNDGNILLAGNDTVGGKQTIVVLKMNYGGAIALFSVLSPAFLLHL